MQNTHGKRHIYLHRVRIKTIKIINIHEHDQTNGIASEMCARPQSPAHNMQVVNAFILLSLPFVEEKWAIHKTINWRNINTIKMFCVQFFSMMMIMSCMHKMHSIMSPRCAQLDHFGCGQYSHAPNSDSNFYYCSTSQNWVFNAYSITLFLWVFSLLCFGFIIAHEENWLCAPCNWFSSWFYTGRILTVMCVCFFCSTTSSMEVTQKIALR